MLVLCGQVVLGQGASQQLWLLCGGCCRQSWLVRFFLEGAPEHRELGDVDGGADRDRLQEQG